MGGCSNKDVSCPQLLDLIPKDRECLVQRGGEQRSHGCSEEKKLELRLGPPGEDWTCKDPTKHNSILSLGYFSNTTTTFTSGSKRGFADTVDMKTAENGWIIDNNGSQTQRFSFSENPAGAAPLSSPWSSKTQQQKNHVQFLQLQSNPQKMPLKPKESSNPCGTKGEDMHSAEKKVFSPVSANPAVTNSSQKRTAAGAPVVGWPPIRSFRKNLGSNSSSKPIPDSQNVVPNKILSNLSEKRAASCRKGLFVKINMDGVPIGRKVDLNAYDSYEKLSSVVDELFRDLLAAQGESCGGGTQNKQEGEKVISGLLDGSGEYTLVYEDNEGDRMLVGDVPWHMFVSTVKRLRVLKTSELSALHFGSKQEKTRVDDASLK